MNKTDTNYFKQWFIFNKENKLIVKLQDNSPLAQKKKNKVIFHEVKPHITPTQAGNNILS